MLNLKFQELFINELGWDHPKFGPEIPITVAGRNYLLFVVAQKRGMAVYQYQGPNSYEFPDSTTRGKIEKEVFGSKGENIIVFVHRDNSKQYWYWTKRQPGRPNQTRSHIFNSNQSGESLIQKLETLVFTIDQEENLTIVDVARTVHAAFDVERVTRNFYRQYKIQLENFRNCIHGICIKEDKVWYASITLNRLMFLYFIQKRGFLDSDQNYLLNHLNTCSEVHFRQANTKQTYFRQFLLRLFHEGLNSPESERPFNISKQFGNIPYLNGGLFEKHELESKYEIQIPDAAFEKIFTFFEKYQWHLDDRFLRNDNEINPDVLGYIFEQHINQKDMGAYYTKEDITEYICRNTIIPYLWDSATESTSSLSAQDSWKLLERDPNSYIHKAMRHGVNYDMNNRCELAATKPLPPHISVGMTDSSERVCLNGVADSDYSLPTFKPDLTIHPTQTESWREHIARRNRYQDIKEALSSGSIKSINELITYNLIIEQFVSEVIRNSTNPEQIKAFWISVNKVTILDPTCGSGAFLLSAVRFLFPIYESCLEAIKRILDEIDRNEFTCFGNTKDYFEEQINRVNAHTNENYFILKSIIVNNLFGVDIMEEAVEICKLRLYLKLIAQVDLVEEIEPLPDIDFNIRTGNALVGFTSRKELIHTLKHDLFGKESIQQIEEELGAFAKSFSEYQDSQISLNLDARDLSRQKKNLLTQHKKLKNKLDRYLAYEFGIGVENIEKYKKWQVDHNPFHWFLEYFSIAKLGGFSVVIGNPPYVSSNKIRKIYQIKKFKTKNCPDIYAWVLERSEKLLRENGRSGMIVPLSISFAKAYEVCRRLLFKRYGYNWFSCFGRYSEPLFAGTRIRNVIHIGYKIEKLNYTYPNSFTTRLHRWLGKERGTLFDTIEYVEFQPHLWDFRIPKINNSALACAFESVLKNRTTLKKSISKFNTANTLYFRKTAFNWLFLSSKIPPCYKGQENVQPTSIGQLKFDSSEDRDLAFLFGNGKLMFVYWLIIGDDFHVTNWNWQSFPIDLDRISKKIEGSQAVKMKTSLISAMSNAIEFNNNAGVMVGTYNLGKCRDVTDAIDAQFAEILGFSEVLEDIELYYIQSTKVI